MYRLIVNKKMGYQVFHAKFFFCSAEEAEGIKKYIEALKPVVDEDTQFYIYDYDEKHSGIHVEYSQWKRDDLFLNPLMRHYPAFTWFSTDDEEWTDDVEHFVFPMFRIAGYWCYSIEDLYSVLEDFHGLTDIEEYDPPKDPAELAEWLNEGDFDECSIEYVDYVADSPSPNWCYRNEYQPLIEKLRQTKNH